MREVFVVRQFSEDSSDSSYLGAFDEFMGAAKGIIAAIREEGPEYGAKASWSTYRPIEEVTEVWFEQTSEGSGDGIYYTVDRMEVE